MPLLSVMFPFIKVPALFSLILDNSSIISLVITLFFLNIKLATILLLKMESNMFHASGFQLRIHIVYLLNVSDIFLVYSK